MKHSANMETSKAEILGKSRDNYDRWVKDYPNEVSHSDEEELEKIAEIIRNHVMKIKGHKYFELDVKSVSSNPDETQVEAKVTSLLSNEATENIFHITSGEVISVEESVEATE